MVISNACVSAGAELFRCCELLGEASFLGGGGGGGGGGKQPEPRGELEDVCSSISSEARRILQKGYSKLACFKLPHI